jgi:hypothetical protein
MMNNLLRPNISGYAAALLLVIQGCATNIDTSPRPASAKSEVSAPNSVNAASSASVPAQPGGIAMPATKPSDAEMAELAKRLAKARWALITERKFEDTFDFLTPSSQLGLNRVDYGRRISTLRVKVANVQSAECQNDVCVVKLELSLSQVVPRVGEVPHILPSDERWSWADGRLGLIRR